MVRLGVNGHHYRHPFVVSALATDADAILGIDFLILLKAKVDLDGNKLWLLKCGENFSHASSEQRSSDTQGRALQAALTPSLLPTVVTSRKEIRKQNQPRLKIAKWVTVRVLQ